MSALLETRPVVVAVAGPNGAGKSTFYKAHLLPAGLRFVNADVLAKSLELDPYVAARMADDLRRELVRQRESFVFETVFSDPVGEKVAFLKDCAGRGHSVVLCFIGLASSDVSDERVAMRVLQGGHDVPIEKLVARFPRTLDNLALAIRELPHVRVYDNSDLRHPFRHVLSVDSGRIAAVHPPVPEWLARSLPDRPAKLKTPCA